jgi:rare lipoprotein A
MKNIFIKFLLPIFIFGFLISCSSSNEFSKYENVSGKFIETGIASWYGKEFHGNKTANGETFNTNKLTAAHRTLPFGSIVRVTNKENNKSVIVRINDRGPFVKNRIIDLSKKAAKEIEILEAGSAEVELRLLNDFDLPENLTAPHYTVQIGSYRNKKDAENIVSRFPNAKVFEAKIDGINYYRIYVGNFTSKSQASVLLNSLKEKGIDGFVKQIEN